jgi:tetratricopeptide (TPR) repeat protein
MKNYQAAVSDFTQPIQIKKLQSLSTVSDVLKGHYTNEDYDLLLPLLYSRANAWIKLGNQQAALKDLNWLIELRSASWSYFDSYYLRGSIRSALGDKKGAAGDYDMMTRFYLAEATNSKISTEALRAIEKAIEINPDEPCIYYFLGNIREAQGMAEEAHKNYTQSISLNPNIADFYLSRSFLNNKLGNKQDLIEDYTQLICLEPQIGETYTLRGDLYVQLGDDQKAVEDYTRAVQASEILLQKFQRGERFYPGAYILGGLGRYCPEYAGYQFAPALSSEQDAKFKLANSYYKQGLAKSKKDKQGAVKSLQKALNLFTDLDDKANKQKVQLALNKLK